MARLTYVYRNEDKNYVQIGRRQLPMVASENLMMLMDLNSKGLCIDSPVIRGKELEEFTRKFNLLSDVELRESLEIDSATFLSVMNQCVQCVGCRRRVERLYNQLTTSGHATLDPLVLKNNNKVLTINDDKLKTPQALGTILYRHHDVLNNLLDSKLRNKTRCVLHSLDAFRSKPFSETWREVWSSMKHNCRDELAVIETKELQEVLENYLKKHKFCQGCRTKIEKAYKILIGENTTKEKGYVAALYANIKKCHPDKHIHVFTNKIDFLDALIRRAEPEVNGSYSKLRERHAKTLEIAQEEVLTCVGMIMYERLRRIYVSLREEERACQVLAAVGVHALSRSFDMFVEKKQGISNLELLYQEISRAEKAKEHKREQKKLKKKKKKNEKKNIHRICEMIDGDEDEVQSAEDEDEVAAAEADVDEAVDLPDDEMHSAINIVVEHNNGIRTEHERCCKDEDEDADEDDEIEDIDDHHVHHVLYTRGECVRKGDKELQSNVNRVNCESPAMQRGSPGSLAAKKRKKQKQRKQKKNHRSGKQNQSASQKSEVEIQEAGQESKTSSRESSVGSRGLAVTTITMTTGSICSTTSPTTVPLSPVRGAAKCNDCLATTMHNCPCENDVRDSGYGSEPNSSHSNSRMPSEVSSAEGSEVSCSEGFCNHESEYEHHNIQDPHSCHSRRHTVKLKHCEFYVEKSLGPNGLSEPRDKIGDSSSTTNGNQNNVGDAFPKNFSLLEMLDASEICAGDEEEEEDDVCYIPQEVLLEYQYKREHVEQQRQRLRESLRQNFERLCKQRALNLQPNQQQHILDCQ